MVSTTLRDSPEFQELGSRLTNWMSAVWAMEAAAPQENCPSSESDSRDSVWLQNLSDLTTIPVEHLVNRHRLAPSELYHW